MNLYGEPRCSCGGALPCTAERLTRVAVQLGLLAALALPIGVAGMTESGPVAALDQRLPGPATSLRAVDRPDDSGGHVLLTWIPPPEAEPRQVGMGASTFTTRIGADAIHRRLGLLGYRVYRWGEGQEPLLVATLPAAVTAHVDSTASDNVLYRYEVRAFDGAGEAAAEIAAGSDADTARMAAAIDNSIVPVDADGRPVLGWFDRSDAVVDLNDFFLFAAHFGRLEGEPLYDGQYDLDGDGRVDFDDFFIFVDHFGREIVNLPSGAGS